MKEKIAFSPTYCKVHLVNRSKHAEFLNGGSYFGWICCVSVFKFDVGKVA